MTEQTGQRGEAETGTDNGTDARAETSQDEADEMAGPDEQSGYEGDSGSSSGSGDGSGSSGSSDEKSSDEKSSDEKSSDQSSEERSSQDSGQQQDGQQSQQNGQQQQDQQQQDQQQDQQGEDQGEAPQGRERRSPINLGDTAWKIANVLGTVVRIVGYALAAVLLAYIVLTLVGVNTANGVAQVIGSIGDFAVLGFRDLFLLSDPIFAVIVNYGLAAVFWILVAEFGSRLVRWLGARLA